MEISSVILLVVSASISFALGRTILHFRNKKKQAKKEQALALKAKALRDAPLGPESKNKSKRKRQSRLSQISRR
jgi:hypothetical protein